MRDTVNDRLAAVGWVCLRCEFDIKRDIASVRACVVARVNMQGYFIESSVSPFCVPCDREEHAKGWVLLRVKQEAEFDVKRSGTHTARMFTDGENGAVRGGVCCECTRERYAETRATCCCLRRAPAGFRVVYPTRCREGHLREGPTRAEADGTVDSCEEVAVTGTRLQKIM